MARRKRSGGDALTYDFEVLTRPPKRVKVRQVQPEQLFLRTLDDLAARIESSDEYVVLMAAALLRKLLIDQTPLMDRVNASYRLKIRFHINGESEYHKTLMSLGPVFWALGDGLEPRDDYPPGLQAPQIVTRDRLLARTVMVIRGQTLSVRDIIDQLAHIDGAVHSSNPTSSRELVLEEAARQLFIRGLPAGVSQVRSIARVVLRGLQPLREAVEGDA